MQRHLTKLNQSKPVIYTGDLNVAVEEIDLKNPKTNHFNPGFSDQERQKMRDLLGLGFADTFRTLYPEKIECRVADRLLHRFPSVDETGERQCDLWSYSGF